MKFFVAFLALAAVAAADVSHLVQKEYRGPEADASVIRNDQDVSHDGFAYGFETSNGIAAQASGQLRGVPAEGEAVVQAGQSHYVAPDGQSIDLTWVADENGFQPQGAHLPTPPAPQAIPEYILRSLEFIAAHPPKPENVARA
ncbi:larval cuticle protein 65Ag1-like [Aricia agestis]|uniref:larval cuticle protein 65Ag1-like n=1 Tax=Aricia agestis TaxID=91739 RepID=UPI001C2074E6|nr:larval cuticle protein 65Ag1-like [Aricia agestis]